MYLNNDCKKRVLIIMIEELILIMFLAGGADATTAIWDEALGSPLPFTWNYTNFDSFNISGIGTENLTIVQSNLGTRLIRNLSDPSGAGLSYNTTRYLVEYEVSKNKGLPVGQALDNTGYKIYNSSLGGNYGNYYAKVNLFGEPYIALNGKANKITRLVLEQKSNEQKILPVGETWNMGDGYTLTAQSIDARASPRQVWVVLSKDGVKLDDKVIAQGQVYTYVENVVAGELDVPLFVTYLDSVFAGTTANFIVLKYTWFRSRDATQILAGNVFDLLRVNLSSSENEIKFDNNYTISLDPNATINLAGDIKFNIIDNSTYLKFYPTVEPRLNITSSPVSIPVGIPTNVIFTVTADGSPIDEATVSLRGAAVENGTTDIGGQANITINATYNGTITAEAGKTGYTNGTTTIQAYLLPTAAMDSWNLQENYTLNLTDTDTKATPRQARLQLSRNGTVVKDSVITQGDVFEYCPSANCTFNSTADIIFNGTEGYLVRLINANQYSKSTGNKLDINATHLFKSTNFTGTGWQLNEGYELRMMDMDTKVGPRLVWLELLKNNTIVDDAVVSWGQRYYYNYSGLTILTARVDAIFKGETSSVVKLNEVNSENGIVPLNNSTHSFISGVINKTDQPLYEGYTISVLGIDAFASPRMAWFELYKNNTMVDDKIVMDGDIYGYDNQSTRILYAEVSAIFSGSSTSAVQLRNVTQYSEINSSILISDMTYTIVTNGSLIPIPTPTATPTPTYGTQEVRGTTASETAIANGFSLSSLPVTWTPQSFAGFYYDLEDDLGKEELSIKSIDISGRSIPKDSLFYNASSQPRMLEVVKWAFGGNVTAAQAKGLKRTGTGQAFEGGNYLIAGWLGEKYVALNGKVDKLAKLIVEHGASTSEKKTLTVSETWDIGNGWTLTAQAIDARATPRQAWLVLGKDGIKKDDIFISQGNVYTYVEKSISNESNVPLFLTYVDSVFAGATSDMVQLRYTWVVSPATTTIQIGDKFGALEVDSITPNLVLKNTNLTVSLSRDSIVDIVGNLKFKVADNDTLRFMPVIESSQPGTYEIRGTVWNETPINGFGGTGNNAVWNASNFAGFFYDLHENIGNESLKMLQTDLNAYQRTISTNSLVYSTEAQPKMLNVVKEAFGSNVFAATAAGLERTGTGQAFENGSYHIVGWQGDKYVAFNGKINKLSKLVLEHGNASSDKKTLAVGETWDIGDGWTLMANSIDANATPRQAWLVLSKDGARKDDKVLAQGQIYTYVENSTADEAYVPLFVTYVDSVFQGATSDMVQLRYTWAISPTVYTIQLGDAIGVFKVVDLDIVNKHLELKNNDIALSLTRDTTMDLTGNLKFKVADNDALRFMPVAVVNGSTTGGGSGGSEITSTTNNSVSVYGEMIILSGNANWGTPPYSYKWTSNIDGVIGYVSKILTFSLSPGIHIITLNISDTYGAANSTSRMITVFPVNTSNVSGINATGPMTWNVSNFPAFWQESSNTSEVLAVAAISGRDISRGDIYYNITRQLVPYKVYSVAGKTVDYGLDSNGNRVYNASSGSYYAKIGWFGRPYVAIAGKANKLAKLVLEQNETSNKTLTAGETWNMGYDWTLTASSIDAKASPRQVWLTLSKDGVKKDDKVVTQGDVYTYVEKSFAGETDVPLFVTYVNSIFAGATSDMVQLRYTWLVSGNPIVLDEGDDVGILTAIETVDTGVKMSNLDYNITLTQGSTINIADGLRFKVNNTSTLDYYPEMTIIGSTIPIWTPTPSNQTIELGASFSYDVNATGLQAITYSVNDTANFSINPSTGLITNTSALSAGVYWLNITATDASGSSISKVITVIVSDTIPPVWNPTPSNQTVELGANFSYSINATDLQTITYSLNDTTNFSIDSSTGVITNSTALSIGIYYLNITATDASDNSVSQIIVVTVRDTMPPAITFQPPTPMDGSTNTAGFVNISIMLNEIGTAILNWDGVNESMFPAGIWASFYSNKTVSLSGNYTFKIYANDTSGNTNVSETREVIVNLTNTADIYDYVNTSTFIINETLSFISPSKNITVTIFNGTNASVNGTEALTSISIDSLAQLNATLAGKLSNDKLIGENLTLGPDGAIFNPDIQLRFNYTDAQLTTAGVSGASQLRVKFYNKATNTWDALTIIEHNTTSNPRYFIVSVSHFTTFALVGIPPADNNNQGGSTSGTSGGGGGGGGGGGTSGENYSNIEIKEKYDMYIFKDKVTSYTFTNKSNPILFVNITGNISAGEINTLVEVLRNTSSLVNTPAPGNVYKNVNIWVGPYRFAVPRNIKEAVIRFRVENSWLDNNNFVGREIRMVKWDGSRWVQLETAEITRNSTYTYYETKTDSFSPFALTGLKSENVPAATPAIDVIETSAPTATAVPTQKAAGFEVIIPVAAFCAIYILNRKRR